MQNHLPIQQHLQHMQQITHQPASPRKVHWHAVQLAVKQMKEKMYSFSVKHPTPRRCQMPNEVAQLRQGGSAAWRPQMLIRITTLHIAARDITCHALFLSFLLILP